MGHLIIPDAVLAQAKMTPAELLLELAIYLYTKQRLTLEQAYILAGKEVTAFEKELAKRGVLVVENQTLAAGQPHFLADLAGSLPGPEGDELAEILERESRYDFSDLAGRLNWKGDGVVGQRSLRGEW